MAENILEKRIGEVARHLLHPTPVADRVKDMLISGGVNIYPRAVVVAAGATVTAEGLLAWTNDRVAAKFQRVRTVHLAGNLPRNVAGKTLETELRQANLELKRG